MLCVVESAIVPEMPFDASTITQHRVRLARVPSRVSAGVARLGRIRRHCHGAR